MTQSSSGSRQWYQKHKRDPYVRDAKKRGYRARSAFKLIEIEKRFHIFKSVQSVLDLGSSPGGWSQVARQLLPRHARVCSIDRVPMDGIEGVSFSQGDITDLLFCKSYSSSYQGLFDLVLSDIAPNLTGVSVIDQVRSTELIHLAAHWCTIHLRKGGGFLVKAFEGNELSSVFLELRRLFRRVDRVKPKASRAQSSELYLWCSERS